MTLFSELLQLGIILLFVVAAVALVLLQMKRSINSDLKICVLAAAFAALSHLIFGSIHSTYMLQVLRCPTGERVVIANPSLFDDTNLEICIPDTQFSSIAEVLNSWRPVIASAACYLTLLACGVVVLTCVLRRVRVARPLRADGRATRN